MHQNTPSNLENAKVPYLQPPGESEEEEKSSSRALINHTKEAERFLDSPSVLVQAHSDHQDVEQEQNATERVRSR